MIIHIIINKWIQIFCIKRIGNQFSILIKRHQQRRLPDDFSHIWFSSIRIDEGPETLYSNCPPVSSVYLKVDTKVFPLKFIIFNKPFLVSITQGNQIIEIVSSS